MCLQNTGQNAPSGDDINENPMRNNKNLCIQVCTRFCKQNIKMGMNRVMHYVIKCYETYS